MSERSAKIIYGSTIPQYEMDDETVDEVVENAEDQYSFVEVIDAIGTEDFKATYNSFLNEILDIDIQKQINFCYQLLEKIEEDYEFTFAPIPELGNQDDVNDIYNLLAFLEYDHIDFFGLVWGEINIDLRKTNISEFCKNNDDRVISIVEEQVKNFSNNELVKIFLGTYIKEKFIEWFSVKTEQSKMLILLRILEGEKND